MEKTEPTSLSTSEEPPEALEETLPPTEARDDDEGDVGQARSNGPGLSLSSAIPGGTISSSRATAIQRASADFTRHDLPHRGAMSPVIMWLIGTIFGIVFNKVDFNPRVQDRIRDANRDGQLVYVFKTTSLLDYFYFNWAFLRFGLPLAEFANGLTTMMLHPLRTWLGHLFYRRTRRKPDYDMAAFQHCLRHGRPIWIFLDKPLDDPDGNQAFSQRWVLRLMQLQDELDRPVQLVPLLLVWDKRPDPHRPSLVDDLFGTSQAPGFFRKGIQFLNMSWQSFFVFGSPVVQVSQPINLPGFRAELPEADTSESAELVRERLDDILAQEHQVIMGPPLRKTRDIKEDILRKQPIIEAIREIAEDEGEPEKDIRQRARDMLNEISADFSLLWMKGLGAALSPFFYLIYKGFHIDMDGLQRLRNTAATSRIVLVPSHKSHIDYLVLSYIFYQYGLMPPHIAAGVNLSFWPMGPIFRHCGAFFLRRTFKGDALYPVVFRQYLVKLLEEGVSIEFFIEGTRSRTGKVIKPRFGMLRMIIDAFIEGRFEELVFQPISIGYEKVIEGSSFRRESMGGEKQAESATSLLKASSVLGSNYGRVFIEFAEPLSLTEYLSRYGIDRDKPDSKALQALTVRLGHRMVYDIAESTPVTPTSLVALILLGAPGRGIGTERMLIEVGFALSVLLDPDKSARLSKPLLEALNTRTPDLVASLREGGGRLWRQDPDREKKDAALGQALSPVLRQAVLLLNKNGVLDIREVHGELFYEVSDSQRAELNYYKNNIIHFFVPEALLATAMLVEANLTEVKLDEVKEGCLFLSKLFKHEFFYEERDRDDVERTQFEAAFDQSLAFFEACGWVTTDREAGLIHIPSPCPPALEFFRGLMLSYTEPYRFVTANLDLLLEVQGGMERKDLMKGLLKRAEIDHLQGDLNHIETLTKPMFENALKFLVDLGVLMVEQVEGKRGRMTRVHRIDPDWRKDERWKPLASQIETFSGRTRRRQSEKL